MRRNWLFPIFFEAGAGAGGSDAGGEGEGEKGEGEGKSGAGKSLGAEEQLLAVLSPEQRALYDAALAGQKSALQAEREANKPGKAALKRLKEIEDAEAKKKQDEMSEIELAKAEAQTARDELAKAQEAHKTSQIRNAVTLEATRQRFADPEDAYNLANLSGIEISEEGEVSGVKEALEKLAKDKPYLVKGLDGQGTPKGGPKESGAKPDGKKESVGMRF